MFKTDFSYITREQGKYDPDPDYDSSKSYDVVYCRTCQKTEIEPEIKTCDVCGRDVCPHCCGTSYGYHEICRQQCDDEIDPLIDRRAYLAGYVAALESFTNPTCLAQEKNRITKLILPSN